eukprot:10557770-Ditylum_brightwellii.AAC.1
MIFKGHSTKVILPNNTVQLPEVVQTEDTITCTQGCNIIVTPSKPTTPPTKFNEYIETLEQCKRDLLAGHQMLVEEEDLISVLKEDIKVFLVSDRGEVDGLSYFGWVIGTHTEELIHHKGHVAGNPNLIE